MDFEFSIGGYFATNYIVKYKEGTLQCYTSQNPVPPFQEDFLSVKVLDKSSLEKILTFLQECKWKKEYTNDICDGIQWELKISNKGKHRNIYGSNVYPDNFYEFVQLLNNLIASTGITIPDYD